MNRPGNLLINVNRGATYSNLLQPDPKLLADSRGDFGVSEAAFSREVVEPGSVLRKEFFLRGGGHGEDG
ncbi:hypothetical protein SLA2020_027130 [Shorea laevis]